MQHFFPRSSLRPKMKLTNRMLLAVSLPLALANCAAPECKSTRDVFVTEVYGKVLEKSCNNCHVGEGTAKAGGSKFILFRDNSPDFVSANIDVFTQFAKIEVDKKPTLLQKPQGLLSHGGGAVLKVDSPEYKILESFVNGIREGKKEVTCPNAAVPFKVTNLSNQELLRKASVNLAGTMPSQAQLDAVTGEAELDEAILGLTRQEGFYDRLREIWNDGMLTEGGGGIFDLGDQYPGRERFTDDKHPKYTPENRNYAERSVREEPTRFIEYVVRNDLPFSDVLAGQYVVANPYLSIIYGLTQNDPPANSFNQWTKQIGVRQRKDMKDIVVPSSGVLSTPAFLTRWPTTPTNKGRKRAWKSMQLFLATDVLKFADRPVDSSQITSVQNPTRNSPACSSCHASGLDEIAGAFRGFREEGSYASFDPEDKWHDDLFAPGFAGAQMPATEYPRAIQWSTQQFINDPRFGIAVARRMFEGITGLKPQEYPKDKSAADFDGQVKTFLVQNEFFHTVGQDFMANKYDIRRVVLAVVKSAYFKAKTAAPDAAGVLPDDLGHGRLLGPEMLSRKYEAVLGIHLGDIRNEARLANEGYKYQWLKEDWELLMGGIDSKIVNQRASAISPTMLSGATYLANVMACRVAAFDFTKPQAKRTLFRDVEINTVPLTPRASEGLPLVAVPENAELIRKNIVNLVWRTWGETHAATDAEITQLFDLYVDSWKIMEEEHLAKQTANTGNGFDFNNYSCSGRWDYSQANAMKNGFTELPMDQRIERDRYFTIRSWQTVLVALLTDYRFLHE
jgi:hypothetical protein